MDVKTTEVKLAASYSAGRWWGMVRLVLVSLLISVSISAGVSLALGANAGNQACVNQGSDARLFAPVVCGMQQQFSWKSENLPHLFRIGSKRRTHLAIAWPPYMVVNKKQKDGNWVMFRVGFRYDRAWRGYIFPTAALKSIDHPVQY